MTFKRIFELVANSDLHFLLLNRHSAAPFDDRRINGDLHAGEWWEIDAATYDYFLNVLPPAYFPGGFAMCEFTAGDVTTCYFALDHGTPAARFFAGSCRMTKGQALRPENMRAHIVEAANCERIARAAGWTQRDSHFTRCGVSVAYVDWKTLCQEEGLRASG